MIIFKILDKTQIHEKVCAKFFGNPLCTADKKRPVLPSFSAYSFVAWLKLEFVEEPGTKQLAEHVQAIAIKIFVKTLLFEFLAPLTSS